MSQIATCTTPSLRVGVRSHAFERARTRANAGKLCPRSHAFARVGCVRVRERAARPQIACNNTDHAIGVCACCKMRHAHPQIECFAIVACMFCDCGVTQGWQTNVTHVAWVAIRCARWTYTVSHPHSTHPHTRTHKFAVFNWPQQLQHHCTWCIHAHTHNPQVVPSVTSGRARSEVCLSQAGSLQDRPCKRVLARHSMALLNQSLCRCQTARRRWPNVSWQP